MHKMHISIHKYHDDVIWKMKKNEEREGGGGLEDVKIDDLKLKMNNHHKEIILYG